MEKSVLMIKFNQLFSLLLCLVVLFTGADAYANGTEIPVSSLGTDGRTISMGNASAANSGAGTAHYYNPASIATVTQRELSFLYSQLYVLDAMYNYANFVNPIKNVGTLGLGLGMVFVGGIQEVSQYSKITGKNYNTTDAVLNANFAREIIPSLSAGAGLNILSKTVETSANLAGGINIGIFYCPKEDMLIHAENYIRLSEEQLKVIIETLYNEYKKAVVDKEYEKGLSFAKQIIEISGRNDRNLLIAKEISEKLKTNYEDIFTEISQYYLKLGNEYFERGDYVSSVVMLKKAVKYNFSKQDAENASSLMGKANKELEKMQFKTAHAREYFNNALEAFSEPEFAKSIDEMEKVLIVLKIDDFRRQILNHFSAGVSFTQPNLFPMLGTKENLPFSARAGLGYKMLNDNLTTLLDFEMNGKKLYMLHWGIEYRISEMFYARAGLEYEIGSRVWNLTPSLGLGFKFTDYYFDYAFTFTELGMTHRLSFLMRFGKTPVEEAGESFSKGKVYFENEEYPKAIECFEQVMIQDPNYLSALLYVRKAKKNMHEYIEKHIGMAIEYYNEEKYKESIEEYKRVLEFDPKNETAEENLKKVQKEFDDLCEDMYQNALGLYKEDKVNEALLVLNKLNEINPDYKDARQYIRDVKRKIPVLVKLKLEEAKKLKENGKLIEAVDKYREALELDKENIIAYEAIRKIRDELKVIELAERVRKIRVYMEEDTLVPIVVIDNIVSPTATPAYALTGRYVAKYLQKIVVMPDSAVAVLNPNDNTFACVINLAPGRNDIKIIAYNYAGKYSIAEESIEYDDKPPSASLADAILVANATAQNVRGRYESEDVDRIVIQPGDVLADIDREEKTFNANVVLAGGKTNELKIYIYDKAGNVNVIEKEIEIPEIVVAEKTTVVEKEKRMEELEKNRKETEAKLKEIQDEASDLNEQLSTVQKSKEELKKEKEELSGKLNSALTEDEKKRMELAKKEEEASQLRENLKRATESESEANRIKAELESQLSGARETESQAKKDYEDAETKITDLTKKIGEIEKQVEEDTKQRESLTKLLGTLNEELAKAQEADSSARTALNSSRGEISELEVQINDSAETFVRLQKEMKGLEDKLYDAEEKGKQEAEKYRKSQEELVKLTDRIKKLTSSETEMGNTVSVLKKKLENAENKGAEYEKEIQEMGTELADAKERIKQLNKEVKERREKEKKLEEQLNVALEDLATKKKEEIVYKEPEEEEEDIEPYKKVKRYKVTSSAEAIAKGIELFNRKEYDECIDVLREGLKLAKNDNVALGTMYYYRGEAYKAKRMYYVALLELKKSKNIYPESKYIKRINELIEELEK